MVLRQLSVILFLLATNLSGMAPAFATEVQVADNIFLVKRGELLTPPLDAGVLEGVTRDAVIEIAQSDGAGLMQSLLTQVNNPVPVMIVDININAYMPELVFHIVQHAAKK